jgi:glycolate oxidase FAD binding subunit
MSQAVPGDANDGFAASERALRDAVDGAELATGDVGALCGVPLAGVFRPRSAESLAAGLAAIAGAGAHIVVRGGGELVHEGHWPERIDWCLDTSALSEVDAFEPEEGVVHAAAGARVVDLRARAAAEGWELPLDTPGAGATVGGAIASAAAGPRAQAFGPTRDAILGLEVALSGGERTRCGGRVVKNVTGFDLAKLYAGSLGTLGVIEGAWLRLRPAPARRRTVQVPDAAPGEALLAAARRVSVRGSLWLDPGAARDFLGRSDVGAGLWIAELAGAPEVVARDLAALTDGLGAECAEADDATLDRLRDRRARPPEEGRVRARMVVRPAAAPDLVRALADALGSEAALALQPALGELRVEASWAGLGTAMRLRGRARAAGGRAVLEALPAAEKIGVECFDLPDATRRLMAEIQRRFDPAGCLAPGRFGLRR